jgi:hypothetical protein
MPVRKSGILNKIGCRSQERNMKKTMGFFAVILLCCAGISTVSGQSNETLDLLLSEQEATLGNTSYLVLVAANIASEDWTAQRSVDELISRDWGFDDAQSDDVVNLGTLAFMVMKSFDIKGGIMYAILPSRRYAAREFAFRKFVPGNSSPYRILSGTDVANILGRALTSLGEAEGTAQ